HSLLAGALQERLQVFLQVLMPSSGYAGQKRNKPVASGSTPIQPHPPTTPNRLRAMSNTPMAIRRMRSRVPTLVFIPTSRSSGAPAFQRGKQPHSREHGQHEQQDLPVAGQQQRHGRSRT